MDRFLVPQLSAIFKTTGNFCDYNLFFHFTILSHQRQLERSHLPLTRALNQLEKLAAYYNPQRIIWRYDPVVIWQQSAGVLSNYSPVEFENLAAG